MLNLAILLKLRKTAREKEGILLMTPWPLQVSWLLSLFKRFMVGKTRNSTQK